MPKLADAAADRARRALRRGAGARAGAARRGIGVIWRTCARAARAAQARKLSRSHRATRSSRSCAASAAGSRITGALVHMAASGPAAARRAHRFHGARSRRLERPRRRRRARACDDRSVHARGRHRARRQGRCAHRPADPRRAIRSRRRSRCAATMPRGSGRSPTTRRSRARRRACSSRSTSRTICSPTHRWRRPTRCATAGHPMIDHLWKERLTLCDMLIAPGAASMAQVRIARPLETLRRAFMSSGASSARQAERLSPLAQHPPDDLAGRGHRQLR